MQVVLAVLALLASCVVGHPSAPSLAKRAAAYYNPTLNGGSMLDNASGYGGEPLNVIISGQSSPIVLTDSGIVNYAIAVGFSTECLGFHLGSPQTANLGDGNGWVNQSIEIRQDYGNAEVGTCLESLIGGNHFRVFRQNGSEANSGALFLAWVSLLLAGWSSLNVCPLQSFSGGGMSTLLDIGCREMLRNWIGRDLLVSGAVGVKSYGGVNVQYGCEELDGFACTW
ncbi:hypothetical protein F5887DRAFT_1161168 [Amanita rubescens]|nr:hypothetical protein F5887DRAFT_1161168 [Amanita rubescens]